MLKIELNTLLIFKLRKVHQHTDIFTIASNIPGRVSPRIAKGVHWSIYFRKTPSQKSVGFLMHVIK